MTTKTKAQTAARLALGLLFTVFGLNGFLHFLPQPPMPEGPATAFLGALAASGYMFPLIKATELTTGLFILLGRYVPLALTVLAPVVVNIIAFHLFLAPAGLPIPLVALTLGVYLAWTERAAYARLFEARSTASRPVASPRIGGHAEAT
jgi:hypothetical protein